MYNVKYYQCNILIKWDLLRSLEFKNMKAEEIMAKQYVIVS